MTALMRVVEPPRFVRLRVDALGRSSVERFERGRVPTPTGRRGDRFLAVRVEDRFLGRARYPGAREAAAGFAAHLVDNGGGAALADGVAAALGLPGGAP